MTESNGKSAFLVDPNSDPVVVRVLGRASLNNSAALRDFITEMAARGRIRFVLDFDNCQSMDSTFLGVLAGAALQLCRRKPPGGIVLARLGARNLELIRNLGLQRILTVDSGDLPLQFEGCDKSLVGAERPALERARLALEAHENLVSADEANLGKFQDVLVYLRDRVSRHGGSG